MNQNEKTILAVDIGFGNLKAVWGHSHSEEICFSSVCPRVTSRTSTSLTGTSMSQPDRVAVQAGDLEYLVGPAAVDVPGGNHLLGHDYINRAEYLALLRGAIYYMAKRLGVVHRKIDALVVGLPVANYSRNKLSLSKLCKQMHLVPVPRALQSSYGLNINVSIERVLVIPQPLGALAAYSKTHALKQIEDDQANLTIDIGYNTFDWLASRGFTPNFENSNSFDGGMAQILRAVARQAGNDLGAGSIDFVELEEGLRSGRLFVNGRFFPMAPYESVIQGAASEVIDRFSNALDLRRRFDNVILAGGAAPYYLSGIRRLLPDHLVNVEPDGVMLNARGFYQIGSDLLNVGGFQAAETA